MLDIGGWELLVIVLVAIIVVGPKELPALLSTVSGWLRRVREMAREFQTGIEDIARDAELDKLRHDVENSIGGERLREIRDDVEKAIGEADPALAVAEASAPPETEPPALATTKPDGDTAERRG